jgi:membrane fusion protein, copper/silver efflux system
MANLRSAVAIGGEARMSTVPGHEAQSNPLPEGAEQPPPGTRTMAIVRWTLVGLMALAATGAWVNHAVHARGAAAAVGQRFLCPMHPQVQADHRGECPICGMDLVPASSAAAQAVAPTASTAAAPAAAAGKFTCPMHPAFVTDDPHARCPECHMKLVPVAAPAAPPDRLPGLAPVELDAGRVQLIGMRTAPATRAALGGTLRAVGFVTPNEAKLVSLSSRFAGWVESLAVAQTGQLVQQGEVLASIYSPDMQNAQQVFLNAIKWADRRPGGNGAPEGGTSVSDLERDARARLELLGVAPQDIDVIAKEGRPARAINVRAPARGYVARKGVVRGLFVTTGAELFQLADLSTVWVVLDVPERDLSRVHVGQPAAFTASAWPGERFSGRVQFIYPALAAGTRTLQARIELANPGLKLRPGMFGDVALDIGAAEGVVVPSEALIDTGERQYVFVDRGAGRFEPRAVKVGRAESGQVAILEGLEAGEVVVTTANFLLDSESRLRAALEGFAPPATPQGR